MLNSNYTLPSKNIVYNGILPTLYEFTYNKIKLLINKANTICSTINCWTSINNISFMAITGHSINENMIF